MVHADPESQKWSKIDFSVSCPSAFNMGKKIPNFHEKKNILRDAYSINQVRNDIEQFETGVV